MPHYLASRHAIQRLIERLLVLTVVSRGRTGNSVRFTGMEYEPLIYVIPVIID